MVFVIHSHESAMGVHVWGRIRMGNTCTPMARRFFTTSAIWEALWLLRVGHKKPPCFLAPTSLPSFWGKPNASQCSHPPYGKVPAASNWGSLQAFLPIAECEPPGRRASSPSQAVRYSGASCHLRRHLWAKTTKPLPDNQPQKLWEGKFYCAITKFWGNLLCNNT